jgi:hypothetical protein
MTDTAEAINAMERLTREIERVAIVRERYRTIGKIDFASVTPLNFNVVNAAPAIHLMTAALEDAHRAASSGDALTIIRVLRDLQGFES